MIYNPHSCDELYILQQVVELPFQTGCTLYTEEQLRYFKLNTTPYIFEISVQPTVLESV